MKSIKILCSLLLVLMVCSAFSLKGSKGKSVYIVGEEGLTNRTCFVYFSNSRKKLQKTINKMKIKYQKGKTLLIREVNPNAFKFKKPEE